MIIQCGKCSTKFRLDDSRITGGGVKVRCTKCQEVFIVTPPPPPDSVEVDTVFGIKSNNKTRPAPPLQMEDAPGSVLDEESAKPLSREKLQEERPVKNNLRFDFSGHSDKGAGEKEPEKPAVEMADDGDKTPPELSFGNINLEDLPSRPLHPAPQERHSEGVPPAPEIRADDDFKLPPMPIDEPPEEGPAGKGASFDDVDFSFGDDDEAEKEKDRGIGAIPPRSPLGEAEGREAAGNTGALSPSPETRTTPAPSIHPHPEAREDLPAQAGAGAVNDSKNPAWQIPSASSEAYNKEARLEAKAAPAPTRKGGMGAGAQKEEFSDILQETISEPGKSAVIEEDDMEGASLSGYPEAKSARPIGYVMAVLIVIVGGAFIYFSGISDRVARTIVGQSKPPAVKTVDIETISGYFAENRNFGRLFVIEAKLKNLSGSPQSIKAVKGVIYNAKGAVIIDRRVSPGRVVTADEIKNLPKEDLLKPFRDPSGGTLPPKATVPVMVLFTDLPAGLSEYGLDIIR
ncbi:MAG: zinc-ribbon domain-containing protein [Deltaproteobacteria bacterium]|nr:zinc-ribbon domain-containing protein [Deltaproteobacteria bacterium]